MSVEQLSQAQGFEPQYKPIQPLGGFNTSVPPEELPDSQSSDLTNLITIQSSLQVDTGYATFGQVLKGIPQKEFEFAQTNAINFSVLITTLTVYYFDTTTSTYLLPSDGNSDTVNGAVASGSSFTLTTGAPGDNIVAGDIIGITLDNGTQLQTTVGSLVLHTLTTADPIPVGRTVLNGAAVVRAPKLNGDLTKQVFAETASANNWLVFTNGVDAVQKFDGIAVTPLGGLAGISVNSCRCLIIFNGHLVLLDVTESGTRKPQRVRRSANTDITNWTTGNSGFNDVNETPDFILSASVIGPYMIVYRAKTIMRCQYTGDATQLFFFEYTMRNVGLLGAGCVARVGGSHDNEVRSTGGYDVIASKSGIFRYMGGFDLQPIGEQIYYYSIAQGGNLNLGRASLCFLFYVQELDEVWFFYPSGQNIYPDTCLRYSNSHGTWHKRKFANNFVSISFFNTQSSITWSADTTRWIDKNFSWDTQASQGSAPILLMCSPDGNQVYSYDYVSSADAGIVIPWSYVSKDFTVPDRKITLDAIVAYGKGTCTCEVSIDRGLNWLLYGTFNFGVNNQQLRLDRQITDDVFRVRFSGSDPSFEMSWYSPKYFEASPW